MENLPRLLTPKEAAKVLGVEPETLNTWRSTKRYNLKYTKVGRLVRYREEDVLNFINSQLNGSNIADDGAVGK